jgi:hypothetical protein
MRLASLLLLMDYGTTNKHTLIRTSQRELIVRLMISSLLSPQKRLSRAAGLVVCRQPLLVQPKDQRNSTTRMDVLMGPNGHVRATVVLHVGESGRKERFQIARGTAHDFGRRRRRRDMSLCG